MKTIVKTILTIMIANSVTAGNEKNSDCYLEFQSESILKKISKSESSKLASVEQPSNERSLENVEKIYLIEKREESYHLKIIDNPQRRNLVEKNIFKIGVDFLKNNFLPKKTSLPTYKFDDEYECNKYTHYYWPRINNDSIYLFGEDNIEEIRKDNSFEELIKEIRNYESLSQCEEPGKFKFVNDNIDKICRHLNKISNKKTKLTSYQKNSDNYNMVNKTCQYLYILERVRDITIQNDIKDFQDAKEKYDNQLKNDKALANNENKMDENFNDILDKIEKINENDFPVCGLICISTDIMLVNIEKVRKKEILDKREDLFNKLDEIDTSIKSDNELKKKCSSNMKSDSNKEDLKSKIEDAINLVKELNEIEKVKMKKEIIDKIEVAENKTKDIIRNHFEELIGEIDDLPIKDEDGKIEKNYKNEKHRYFKIRNIAIMLRDIKFFFLKNGFNRPIISETNLIQQHIDYLDNKIKSIKNTAMHHIDKLTVFYGDKELSNEFLNEIEENIKLIDKNDEKIKQFEGFYITDPLDRIVKYIENNPELNNLINSKFDSKNNKKKVSDQFNQKLNILKEHLKCYKNSRINDLIKEIEGARKFLEEIEEKQPALFQTESEYKSTNALKEKINQDKDNEIQKQLKNAIKHIKSLKRNRPNQTEKKGTSDKTLKQGAAQQSNTKSKAQTSEGGTQKIRI